MLQVHSLETFGVNEGPGLRLVVFLQGCNFRCLYCHNPDTQDPTGGEKMSTKKILELLEKQRPYFTNGGGLSVSGGEPLLQAESLVPLFRACRKRNFHTCLCTNGARFDAVTQKLLTHTDLVLLDIKQMNPRRHLALTGQTPHTPLVFADHLRKIEKPFCLRYVLVPGHTDAAPDLHALGQHFQGYTSLQAVWLLPYHTLGVHKYAALGRPYALAKVKPPSPTQLHAAQEILKQYFKSVIIL